MNDTNQTAAPAAAVGRSPCLGVYRGLLWREWLTHRGLIGIALGLWLILIWVLELLSNVEAVGAFAIIYGLIAGQRFGGSEVVEGSEEFAFSLPATRSQRYLAKLFMGGGTLLFMLVIGNLAVAHNWPQALWGLFVQSGFTQPFPLTEHRLGAMSNILAPLLAYVFTFAVASASSSRGTASAAWLLGPLLCVVMVVTIGAAVAGVGMLIPWINGREGIYIVGPIGLAWLAVVPVASYLLYRRKEGVSQPALVTGRGRWWIWILVPVVLAVVLFALLFSVRQSNVSMRSQEQERAAASAITREQERANALAIEHARRSQSPGSMSSTGPKASPATREAATTRSK